MNFDAGMSRADQEALAELFDSGRVRRTFDRECRRCDLDLHACPGCGEPLDHSRGVCGPCMWDL